MNSRQENWPALVGIALASFLGCIDFTIVNTALPSIQGEFNSSFSALQWVMNGFVIALSALMITMGRLGDLLGHRRIFYSGLTVFGAASLLAGWAPSLDWLIAARLLQGIGCAVLFTNSGALVAHVFPAGQQGRALGWLFGINGLGLAIGPFLGGLIVATVGWRWIFLINLPIVLLSLAICRRALADVAAPVQPGRIDVAGTLLLTGSLAALTLALVQGGQWGWQSAPTLGLLAASVLGFAVFYCYETRIDAPILDFRLLAHAPFFCSSVASFTLGAFYCLAFFLMPMYLDLVRGLGAFELGLMLLPTTAGVALISPFVGRLADRWGTRPLILTGLALFMLSALMQAGFLYYAHWAYVIAAFLAMGIGWGCILSPSTTAAIVSLPPEYTGAAVGTLGSIQNIGGSLGLTLGVAVFNASFGSALAKLPDADTLAGSGIEELQRLAPLLSLHGGMSLDQAATAIRQSFLAAYGSTMFALLWLCAAALLYLAQRMRQGEPVVAPLH